MTSTARPSTVEIFTIHKNCHFARHPPISHLACVTLDYFHPLPPCQAYMIRPWWLLLSFSPCNVVFHAFLLDLLDQQYSLFPSALPPRSPCPFPPSIGLTYTAESRELAFRRGRFSGSLDHDALIDFLSPAIFEACLRIMGNKEKCQNDQEMIFYSILLFLSN